MLVLQGHLVLTLSADAMPKAPGPAKTPVQTSFLLFSETPSHTEESLASAPAQKHPVT